jgi:hypothetical protein
MLRILLFKPIWWLVGLNAYYEFYNAATIPKMEIVNLESKLLVSLNN